MIKSHTMKNSPKKLVIASRESALAMWQAKHIQARLQALYPICEVTILGMTTTGDQILDSPLARIGGKGLFVKELETALANGSACLLYTSILLIVNLLAAIAAILLSKQFNEFLPLLAELSALVQPVLLLSMLGPVSYTHLSGL